MFVGIVAGVHNVATHYFAGKGVQHSFEKAAEYFQKASDIGFAPAQVNTLYTISNDYYIILLSLAHA